MISSCRGWAKLLVARGEPRELSGDVAVDPAPEWHHEIGDAVETFPAPGIELGGLVVARRQRIDVCFAAGEAQREPFLALAAEFAEPVRRPEIGRKLVNQPVGLAEIGGI